MPEGRVTLDREFPPRIPHLRARISRDRGRCLATPALGQGETLPCGSLTACPWGLAPGRHTAGDRRVHRAGEPSGQSYKAVTASGDWGTSTLLVGTRVVAGRTTPSGAAGFFPRPASSMDPTLE